MFRRPNTWILLGRTRVTAISRSVAPISRPTPEPKANSFRKSWERAKSSGMVWLVAPRGVVPPQDMDRGSVTGRHVLDLRRHRPLHVRKLPVGQAHPRRRADGEDGVALQAQHLPAGSAVLASTWLLEPNTDRHSTSPLRRIRRGSPGPGSPWAGTYVP